jgi:hypothetical protein
VARVGVATLAIWALAAAPALAALPGAPTHVRVARPADVLPRSGARFEEWTVQLVDPRSRASLTFRVLRSADGNDARLLLFDRGRAIPVELGAYPARGRRTAWRLARGTAALVRRGRTWRLRVDDPGATVRIALRQALPGVRAERWRLGREAGQGALTMTWSTPVATSRASGSVRTSFGSRRLRGWRASIEHRWGFFGREWSAWDFETTAASHGRGRSAVILHGVDRTDFITGPGARDAFWLGLLVRATPRGTTWCRPRIKRTGWLVTIDGPAAAGRTVARCGRRRVTFRRTAESIEYRHGITWQENTARARSSPRGAAWLRSAGRIY